MKKGKNGNGDSQVPNIIAYGTNLAGDTTSEGDFRIEGSIVGKIVAKGRIVVGESGMVDGEIFCSNADICGKVIGKLNVENLTILKASASFKGELATNKISIEPGAEFNGTCTMASSTNSNTKK